MSRINFRVSRCFIGLAAALWVSSVLADPNVKIITPADGAFFGAGESIAVTYELVPNPGGDHSHIYINHKEAGILRKKSGTYEIDPLPLGTHSICLKVVNKGHASIGQETCIKITRTE